MIHPKLTAERMERTLVYCYAYPKNRFNATHFSWLADWRATSPNSIWFQPNVNLNLVCTKNQALEWCLESPAARNYDEFVFIDPDTTWTHESTAFWDSDADVVCCEADMQDASAWNSPIAFHDSLWRVKRKVIEALTPPYFYFQFNGKGTRQWKCICRSFADAARAKGFSVERSGKCGHDHDKTWTTRDCMYR